jgi:hypothetical protein
MTADRDMDQHCALNWGGLPLMGHPGDRVYHIVCKLSLMSQVWGSMATFPLVSLTRAMSPMGISRLSHRADASMQVGSF